MHPAKPTIWVSAFICGEVLRETRDLLSAVRISNAYYATPFEFPPEGDAGRAVVKIYAPVNFKIIVAFWCEQEAVFDVLFKASRPDGTPFEELPAFPKSHLLGGAAGLTLSIDATIPGNPPGLYWFEIYVDEELKFRLPLMVLHEPKDSFLSALQERSTMTHSPSD